MKKSTHYAPYIFAVLIPGYTAVTNNLLFKPGLAPVWLVFSLILLITWRLNERLLNVSDNLFLKWSIFLLGISLFIASVLGLEYYFMHLFLPFTEFTAWSWSLRFFTTSLVIAFFIEGVKWTRAREQSKLENLTLQAENIETQFNLLIQQVNPDFLFHSLTTLQTMVRSDGPKAEEYILKLADVYRQTLKKDRSVVSLEDELAFLQSYLFLMRYGQEDAITFNVNISDESLGYHLPVFSLQLLGENCIKHNVFSETQPLRIQLFQKDAKSITVANNYQPKAIPTESYGIGIENLKMRYTILGIDDAVTIEQNETTYATTIKLF